MPDFLQLIFDKLESLDTKLDTHMETVSGIDKRVTILETNQKIVFGTIGAALLSGVGAFFSWVFGLFGTKHP